MHRDDVRALRKKATSGARWTGVATGARITTQLVQLAILARLLEPEDFGLMAMINVVVVFGQSFGDVGISNAIIHYRDATRRELSSLYWLNIFGGVVVYLAVVLISPLVAGLFGEPRLNELLDWGALVFLITPVGHQFQVLLERELDFKRVARVEVAATILGAGAGITMAIVKADVTSLIVAMLAHAGTRSLLYAVLGWRHWRPRLGFAWADCRRFIRFGAFQMGERSLNLLSQQLDKLLIGVMMGAGPLGYYDLAYRLIARPYQTINPVFTRVAFPVFSRVQNEVERLRKGFLELIEVLGAIMIPIYVALAALAAPVVFLQLGPQYGETVGLVRVLAILGGLYALGNPLGSVLLARGRADVAFFMNLLRIAVYAGAIWIGSRFGLSGVAWALVISFLALLFPVGFYVRWWLMQMSPGVYLKALWPFSAAAAVAGAVVYALAVRIGWPDDVVALAVLLPVGAGVYIGLLRLWKRDSLERVVALVRS